MLRTFLAAAFFAPLLTTGALAYDQNVRRSCKADYFEHCSQHSVGSDALRACMRKVGSNLRPECVHALVQAGEVTPRAKQHAGRR